MGIRFRKSIKVAPGVKLNVGKKSVGVSVGGKYGGVSVNSKTGARARVSAPNTGLSYSTQLKTASPKTKATKSSSADRDISCKTSTVKEEPAKKTKSYYQKLSIFALVCGIAGLLLSCVGIGILPAIAGVVLSAICLSRKSGNKKMAVSGLLSSLATVLIFFIIISAPDSSPSNADTQLSSSSGSSGDTGSSQIAAAIPTPTPEDIAPTATPTPTEMPVLVPTPTPTLVPTPVPTETPVTQSAGNSNSEGSSSSGASQDSSSGDSNYNTYDNKDQQSTTSTYVLNTGTKKIHYPSCSSVPKIAPQNYSTSSDSLDTLKSQGYTTCGICFK